MTSGGNQERSVVGGGGVGIGDELLLVTECRGLGGVRQDVEAVV